MSGALDDDVILQRQTQLAVDSALSAALRGLPARETLFAGGSPEAVQNGGEYDDDGNWVSYLRCGDPLGSAGLGP